MEKLQFHSFDAFRFFAFFKVYIFHATAIVVSTNSASLQWFKDHITHGGGIGVSFFFVLSGFLITYILTYDKIKYGQVNLKKFFLRRAFRIWPLFFLIVIIAFVIPPKFAEHIGYYMNGGGYEPDWRFSFTFLENYKMIIEDNMPKTSPLASFWSLCIEEHFYIVWMLAFFLLKRKWIPYFLGSTVVLAIVARIFEAQIYQTTNISTNDLLTNADYFAISGLLGYFTAVNYERVAAFVNKIPMVVKIGYILIVLYILYDQKFLFANTGEVLKVIKYTLFSLMFAGLLLIFIPQQGRLKISDTHIFSRLGRISYGLYVYHLIWIHIIYKFFIDSGIQLDSWRACLIFVFTTFTGTVITSVLSYRYFEKPFLNLRERFFPS